MFRNNTRLATASEDTQRGHDSGGAGGIALAAFRRAGFAAVGVVMLVSNLGNPAAAATRNSTNVRNVWGTMGVFGTNTDFFATWTYQSHSDGTSTISKVEMDAAVEVGDDCPDLVCADWSYGFTAKFLSASGTVLKTVSPHGQACYAAAWAGRDRVFIECSAGSFTLPPSASKVKFSWSVSVQNGNGFWLTPWGASKTVTVY